MDWTGGARRRFAPKKGNAVLQKQKAYFVRARAALNAPSQHNATERPSAKRNLASNRSLPSNRDQFSRGQERGDSMRDFNPRGRPAVGSSGAQDRTQVSRARSPSIVSLHYGGESHPTSAEGHKIEMKHHGSHHRSIEFVNDMNDEERLLLANRRRLLAQSDWLGLAPAQPLSMKFSSTYDRDRIGKRRRLDKSRSRRDKQDDRRVLTPLFERRLTNPDHMMSGALPDEGFHIKIGTDALATGIQTQSSHRSHTPANTSMRPPSTELELLSEESMLLDADENACDPLPVSDGVVMPAEPMQSQTQHVCEVPNMLRPEHAGEAQTSFPLQESGHIETDINELSHDHHEIDDEHHDGLHLDTTASFKSARPLLQETINSIALEDEERNLKIPHPAERQTEDRPLTTGTVEDDDELWRNFLDVARPILSNPSNMAVKSSSPHVTSSQSDHRPVLIRYGQLDDKGIRRPMFPDRDGHMSTGNTSDQFGHPEKLQSPSTSLKRITDLADQPAGAAQDDKQVNAIWREFVCGAQDDSDTSSQIVNVDRQFNSAVANPSTQVLASSSLMVSDLGTSNKTSVGRDTVVVEESVDGIDNDSIEDEHAVPTQKGRPRNIHAVKTLNPKRFLPAQRHRPTPPTRSSKFIPSNQIHARKSGDDHFLYDLIDSDGNSLC